MQKYASVVQDKTGRAIKGASVLVKKSDNSSATIYSDNGGTVIPGATMTTDGFGGFAFYAADGRYNLYVTVSGNPVGQLLDVLLEDPADGSAALAATSGASKVGFIQSGTGAVARTVQDELRERVSVTQYGATGNGVVDDKADIQDTVNAHPNRQVAIPEGDYNLSSFINGPGTPFRVRGRGPAVSKLKATSAVNPAVFTADNTDHVSVEGVALDVTSSGIASSGHPISLVDVDDVMVRDVEITGLAGTGSAILVYPALEANHVQHTRIENVKVIGNKAASDNTNGPLVVNGMYAQMRGLYAEQIVSFAVEYKNDTKWSTISDAIMVDSSSGLSYGQTTLDQTGVSYTAVTNFVTKDCGTGVVLGKGGYNAVSNGVVHIGTPYGIIKIGVRTSGDTVGNALTNMLVVGDVEEAVRLGSLRNFVSASVHTTNTAVTLEAGSQGNAVEVQHPGTRTSILTGGAILDVSGNASLSGVTANPIYCHATGEYRGSLSGRWRWQHDTSGSAPAVSTMRWVFESKGDSFVNVLNDGTGSSGYTVGGPSNAQRGVTYNWGSDYWRIFVGNGAYRFFGNVVRSETDLAADLGAATLRWKTGYFQNVVLTPPASVTPANNGDMTFELTSNTQLKIKVKGSDGTVRSTTLTLA